MPGADHILAIDIGSSKTGCSVFTSTLREVAARKAPTPVTIDSDISPLARSIPLDDLWRSITAQIRDALGASKIPASQISRIAVTGQREAMVFLDSAGKALYAGPNTDLRALMEGAAIDEAHLDGIDGIYEMTGHRPSFMFAPAKLQWMRGQKPKDFARVDKVISLPDWLVFKLTGQILSEVTLAQECGYACLNGKPANYLFKKVGLSDKYLPTLASSGSLAGEASGLKPLGLQNAGVYLAGPDTQCALLGMGAVSDGDVGIVAGFSSPLQMVTDKAAIDPQKRIWTGRHIIKNKWVIESNAAEVGASYKWLVSLLFGSDSDRAYQQAEALAGRAPAGSNETLVMLGPSVMDMRSLGLRPGGIIFPVPMTMASVEKGQIIRAALEAVAYATKQNLLQLEAITGKKAERVSLCGGFVKNKLYCQVLADVLNREVLAYGSENMSAAGAAMCAKGLKTNSTIAPVGFLPGEDNSSGYNHYYKKWLAVSKKISRLTEVLN